MLSSYYETLDIRGRGGMKLEAVILLISDDAYLPRLTEKFHSDMSQQLKIKYGHIICLFYLQTRDYFKTVMRGLCYI